MDVNAIIKYFDLNEHPFMTSPDPRYLYFSSQVKEALAKCEFMARDRIGPIYMYGPIGSGKTSLVRRLQEKLGEDERYNVKLLISPNLKSSNAFLRLILETFDVKTERSYTASLKNFEEFLLKQFKEGKIPVLLIDEAQYMTRDTLKLIHYLLNFETNKTKLLQIVLVGTKIIQYRELASRMFPIAMNAMSLDDLKDMILFRLNVAGWRGELFRDPDEAYKTLYTYTKGIPEAPVQQIPNRVEKTRKPEIMNSGNHDDSPTIDSFKGKPSKYSTLLDAALIKKIKLFAAERELKDYEVIEHALTEYFDNQRNS